ncbi:YopX family protein [Pseudostreptobacillus hongkongensis]|uniref:YopX family protein n=1 Tax=Pseudostreptobacillus hongkongensis TaxID=1162717 RepID=UPI00082F4E0C|nr:YopX family protein [Pseudostreptobacillus hongkongensis]
MRKIKFRAWDLDEKKTKTVNSIDFTNDLITVYDKESLEHVLSFGDVDLMQFTGITDVYDNGIYDGDIVEISSELSDETYNMIVEFDEDRASFVLIPLNKDTTRTEYLSYYKKTDYQIIGNIYENKELLEQDNK